MVRQPFEVYSHSTKMRSDAVHVPSIVLVFRLRELIDDL